MNGSIPDIHGKATVEALAGTTVILWLLSLASVSVPGEVGAAITTLIGVGVGIYKGSKYNHRRRKGDPVT